MGVPIIDLRGMGFTSISSVFSEMVGWIAEMLFICLYCCVTDRT